MRPVVLFVIVALAMSISTAIFAEQGPPTAFAIGASDYFTASPTLGAGASSTTMPGLPPTTTTTSTTLGTSPPTTSPVEIARNDALGSIPDEILAPLGGAQALKVSAFDTIDSELDNWTGISVDFTDGLAVMGKGVFTRRERLAPPFAVVGRLSHSADGWFAISVEDGTWNTPGYRAWGLQGGRDGFLPNVWEGSSEPGPDAVAIPTNAGTWYWVVLAVNADSALYGVWEDGADATAVGEVMEIDWDVDEWKLAIQVFPDGGLLSVDEYYVLTP